jgi:hypothetical protein
MAGFVEHVGPTVAVGNVQGSGSESEGFEATAIHGYWNGTMMLVSWICEKRKECQALKFGRD